MIVTRVEPKEWLKISEDSHKIAFNEVRPGDFDRISYALVVGTENVPVGYITIRELDKESAYIQHGGAFPGAKGTSQSFQGFCAFIDWLKNFGYLRINMIVSGTNRAMLKFALSLDFNIIGMRIFNNETFVELLKTV